MAISEEALLRVLSNQRDSISASQLSALFGVTTRTIRSYVKKINETTTSVIISSSHRGYLLCTQPHEQRYPEKSLQNRSSRKDRVITRLLEASRPLSVYDLAEDLHVSDSAFAAVLHEARKQISAFGLTIERTHDLILLKGLEINKRRLIGHLISSGRALDSPAFLVNEFSPLSYDNTVLTKMVSESLGGHGLDANDYGLSNIIVHFAISINRMKQQHGIKEIDVGVIENTLAFSAARDMLGQAAKTYGFEASTDEVYYLALIVSTNTKGTELEDLLPHGVESLLGKREVKLTQRVIRQLEQTYQLEPFDDSFVMQLAVHIQSLLTRAKTSSWVRNPLTAKTKESYPLIYDMAVYLANALSNEAGITLNEDEIAFLAFHIGGYFQNKLPDRDIVTYSLLYFSYHGQHQAFLDFMSKEFGDAVKLVQMESLTTCNLSALKSDLVFTPTSVMIPHATQVVVCGPLLMETDKVKVRSAVTSAFQRKHAERVMVLLRRFLRRDLFHRDLAARDAQDMIKILSSECVEKGLCNDYFCCNVLRRERLSSTAFGDQVAVPHPVQPSAYRPFLSMVINRRPIPWGIQEVNMVLLIGTSEHEGESFRTLYECLLEVLSDPVNASQLIVCSSYDEFVANFEKMITGDSPVPWQEQGAESE